MPSLPAFLRKEMAHILQRLAAGGTKSRSRDFLPPDPLLVLLLSRNPYGDDYAAEVLFAAGPSDPPSPRLWRANSSDISSLIAHTLFSPLRFVFRRGPAFRPAVQPYRAIGRIGRIGVGRTPFRSRRVANTVSSRRDIPKPTFRPRPGVQAGSRESGSSSFKEARISSAA